MVGEWKARAEAAEADAAELEKLVRRYFNLMGTPVSDQETQLRDDVRAALPLTNPEES